MESLLGSRAFCLESEAASALMLKRRRGREAWSVREDLLAAQTALRAKVAALIGEGMGVQPKSNV